MNPDVQNTIPCKEASEWTKAWRDRKTKSNCNAFLLPVVDLIEVLNEMGVLSDEIAQKAQGEACIKGLKTRAYLAIDPGTKKQKK